MRKIKLIIGIMLICCLIGCGGDTGFSEVTGTDNPGFGKNNIFKPDGKDENADISENKTDNSKPETSKPQDEPEEKISKYPISTENNDDIYGKWYGKDGWELYVDIYEGLEFPNIATLVLCDGYVNIAMFLDETGRINEYSFYQMSMDETLTENTVSFTEDGIVIKGVKGLDFGEMLFTRESMYQDGPTAGGTSNSYTNYDTFYCEGRYIGDGYTYFELNHMGTDKKWMMCVPQEIYDQYEYHYFVPETVTFYPDRTVKGYPYCELYTITVMTQSEYDDYLNYGDDYFSDAPLCEFEEPYSQSFYIPEVDAWVIGNVDKDGAPFEIVDVELYEKNGDEIKLMVKVRNNGNKPYGAVFMAYFCDQYSVGYDGAMLSTLYKKDGSIPKDIVIGDDNFRMGIPPQEEGYLMFMLDDENLLTFSYDDVSDISIERIYYLYIDMYAYNVVTEEMEDQVWN